MSSLNFTLPIPPSVNAYLGKKVVYSPISKKQVVQVYKTTVAKQYDKLAINTIKREIEKNNWKKTEEFQYVIVEYMFFIPHKKVDSDNCFKLINDAITASGAVYDDSMIIPRVIDVIINKNNPRVEVKLYLAEKVGIFANIFALNNFILNYCENCSRYKRNCSLLRSSKENKITPEISGDGLVFKCSACKSRC